MLAETEKKAVLMFEKLSEKQRESVLRYAEAAAYENILRFIRENPGILQKEIYRQFPHIPSKIIRRMLRRWEQNGTIIRTKLGNTYSLTVR